MTKFNAANTNRNEAATKLRTVAPMSFHGANHKFEIQLQSERGQRDCERRQKHHAGMAKRKPETDTERTPAILDELARNVVDGGNVIGIDCVPHAEAIRKECGAKQSRMIATATKSPRPGGEVCDDQKSIEDNESTARRTS